LQRRSSQTGLSNILVSSGNDTPESIAMTRKSLECITADYKRSGKEDFIRRFIGIPSALPIFQILT
jgi:pyruvate formate lyase activating enzyme